MDPGVDVTAALAAAVVAAAEIAKNGFDNGLFSTDSNVPLANAAAPPPTPSETRKSDFPNSPSSGAAAVSNAEQNYYHPIPEPHGSVGLHQSRSQDSAGQEEKQSNDASSVNSAENSASGEKAFEESEEDAGKRLARSRERNREHARRTRMRKKAQLEALESKVRGLEAEKKVLKQKIEECSIASILVGLAEPDQEDQQDNTTSLLDDTIKKTEADDNGARISMLTTGKRKRFASVDNSEENRTPQPLKLRIDGETRVIGPNSHINWKSGVYSDEDGVQRQLTSEQLENLRYVY